MGDPEQSGLTRRGVLRAVAAGTGTVLAGCQSTADPGSSQAPSGAVTEERGLERFVVNRIPFDRSVDVTDIGVDPSADTDLAPVLNPRMKEGTLFTFPSGTYRLDSSLRVTDDRIGFLGVGSVTFRPSASVDGKFVSVDGTDQFYLAGINADLTAQPRSGMRLHVLKRLHVENVTYLGRGGLTGQAFNVAVRAPDGVGRLRNVNVPSGGQPDRYDSGAGVAGNGRIGVWTGLDHRGTLRIERSEFSEFGNNGLYTSRTPGNVQVIDSRFVNNNVCGVRIAAAGSYVENCEVVVDFRRYDGPPLRSTTAGFNPRGVMIDGGKVAPGLPEREPGAEVRNSRISIRNTPPGTNVQAAIEQNPVARSLQVTDSVIEVDVDGTPAVRRARPGSGGYTWRPSQKTPPRPFWTRLDDTTITGSASGGAAVELTRADGARIRNCSITNRGANRDGIRVRDTLDPVISGGTCQVAGAPIVVETTDRPLASGCRLLVGERPELGTELPAERFVEYGPFAPGTGDGDPTCVLRDGDAALPDDPWELRIAAFSDGSVMTIPA